MDLSTSGQLTVQLLVLLLFFWLWKLITRNKSKHSNNNGIQQVPEPRWAWPVIGHLHCLASKSPVARVLGAIADEYGPVYSLRLGQRRVVVVNTAELARECLTTSDSVFATRPKVAVSKYLGYNYAAFAMAPYGSYWRSIKKIVTMEFLSSQRLGMLKHIRTSELDSFVKDLQSLGMKKDACTRTDRQVNMNELFECLTLNIVLRKIVGKGFPICMYRKKGSEAWRMKHAVEKGTYFGGAFVVSDAIPWLEWLDFGGYLSSMKKTAEEADYIIGNLLEEHVQKKLLTCQCNDEKDFMDVLLSVLPEDGFFSGHSRDTVIKATALILILTATEGPCLTLTWALSLLLNNPHVLKAAQEELDSLVGKDRWVQEADIPNLKYLEAIVKETLRLYPPGPIAGPREALEDCYVGGYFVPKGTNLIINLWKLHRDPHIWQNPNEFQPERFMTTHANIDVKSQNLEYMPFSLGRRSCPGINYGLLVVQFTMARLLQGFDVSTVGGNPVDMQEGFGLALPKLNPLQVIIKPRLPLELYTCL